MSTARRLRTSLIFVLAWALLGCAASAQSPDRSTRVWLALGLAAGGAASLDTDAGAAVHLSVQRGAHQVSIRSLAMGDLGGFPDGSDDALSEFGVLYGRSVASSFGYAAVSVGLSLVSGSGFPGTDGTTRHAAGMPVVAEVGLHARVVGLGFQLFGNLNSLASYAGAALMLKLGRLP